MPQRAVTGADVQALARPGRSAGARPRRPGARTPGSRDRARCRAGTAFRARRAPARSRARRAASCVKLEPSPWRPSLETRLNSCGAASPAPSASARSGMPASSSTCRGGCSSSTSATTPQTGSIGRQPPVGSTTPERPRAGRDERDARRRARTTPASRRTRAPAARARSASASRRGARAGPPTPSRCGRRGGPARAPGSSSASSAGVTQLGVELGELAPDVCRERLERRGSTATADSPSGGRSSGKASVPGASSSR